MTIETYYHPPLPIRADQPSLIAFEGIDGAGKSTQIRLLRDHLLNAGKEVVVLGEPGGTDLGRRIRQAVVNTTEIIHPPAELLGMLAARIQAYHEVLKPALERDAVVLLDRYAATSVAYQGFGRKLGAEMVETLCDDTLGYWHEKPDLYIHLDLTVEAMRRRLAIRAEPPDRFESLPDEFYTAIRDGYADYFGRIDTPVATINADQAVEDIQRSIRKLFNTGDDGGHDLERTRRPTAPKNQPDLDEERREAEQEREEREEREREEQARAQREKDEREHNEREARRLRAIEHEREYRRRREWERKHGELDDDDYDLDRGMGR